MKYRPILGCLGYIVSKDRKKVLLVHRIAREDDDHLGKYNGLGGKMASNEDAASCMKREIQEEAGIKVTEMTLRGTINWTGFGPKGEDWMGFIFLITGYEGELFDESPEGPLSWVSIEKLRELPMWDGDRYFIPLVFDDDPRIFHGYMPYKNGKVVSWEYTRV